MVNHPWVKLLVGLAALSLVSSCSSGPSFQAWTLEELTADKGFTLRTPEYDIPPGTEKQHCYFVRVPDINQGGDVWIDKTVTAINPGSHHMNVFRVKTIGALDPAAGEPFQEGNVTGTVVKNGECFKSANWADWPLVMNSQSSSPTDPYTTWKLPDNVAHRFHPGEMLMLQVHHVNATTQKTPFRAKAGVNFYRATAPAPMELGTLFATQQSIRICRSNPTPSYHGTCSFPPGTVTITAANGHFHSRGEIFRVYTWDGRSDTRPPDSDRFYESRTWDDPPMSFGLDIRPPEGGGIWWTCDFRWRPPSVGCDVLNQKDRQGANDCCYTFGPEVEPNEHCNVFVYYYPKTESGNVFCN
jgi:hypothetical protein